MKKKNKGKLIVGLFPFIIYLLLAIFPAYLSQAGTGTPFICDYIRWFFDFCWVFWPATIVGVIFIFLYIFPKKDNKHDNIIKE